MYRKYYPAVTEWGQYSKASSEPSLRPRDDAVGIMSLNPKPSTLNPNLSMIQSTMIMIQR